MPAAPAHLAPDTATGRLVTRAMVLAALAAGGLWFHWRLTAGLAGVSKPLAALLFAAEMVVTVRFLFVAVPGLALRVGAQVDAPSSVPDVDVAVVVGNESARSLRLTLTSAQEIRGKQGLVVVSTEDRPEIQAMCRHLGVPLVDVAKVPELGTEPNRSAALLLLIPAGLLVSPDISVVLSPALADGGAGAVAGATTVHATVALIGSAGYPLDIDADEALAARLDTAGAAPPMHGAVLFRKAAVADAGGVAWASPAPILATHDRVARTGHRTRFVHPPVAYRMAPVSEAAAHVARSVRVAQWRSLGRSDQDAKTGTRTSLWTSLPRWSARVETLSAGTRLLALVVPATAALTGRLPISLDDPLRLAVLGSAWFGLAALARGRLTGTRPELFQNVRAGARVLGTDIAGLGGSVSTSDRGASRRNLMALALLLGSVSVTVWASIIRPTDLSSTARVVLAVAALATTGLIRDASGGFRQLRNMPRVNYQSRGRHDLLDLSPLGYSIDATDPVGTRRRLELDLPLPGNRSKRVSLDGVVTASTKRDGLVIAKVRTEPDRQTFEDLYYFCAVTAPTIRWMGGSARVESADGYRTLQGT